MNIDDCVQRLRSMAEDQGSVWDLSDNDRFALRIAVSRIEALERVAKAARRRLGYCECDWEGTGHTGACRDLAFALAALDKVTP